MNGLLALGLILVVAVAGGAVFYAADLAADAVRAWRYRRRLDRWRGQWGPAGCDHCDGRGRRVHGRV